MLQQPTAGGENDPSSHRSKKAPGTLGFVKVGMLGKNWKHRKTLSIEHDKYHGTAKIINAGMPGKGL